MIIFILQKANQSLQVCLDDFFTANNWSPPTKSAFTQARKKLSYKVFKKLNRLICRAFYKQANFKKWKGFRVLSVDGSTLQLPDHESLGQKFSRHLFGPKADAGHWMGRISYLYDVFNGLVIDAQMESYKTSEAHLCQNHLPFVNRGDLVLFDRYYASFQLMFQLLGKGTHFVFRMKDNWWKCVDEFVKTGLNEQIVTIALPKKHLHLLKKYPHLKPEIKIRLVKKVSRKGGVQVYATSLLDTDTYSAKSILNLYKQRWGIEEAYKLIKSRLEVADFSGKTAWAVQQDFYAKTLLISLCNVLCFQVKPKVGQGKSKKEQARTPIINRTYALHHLKVLLGQTIQCGCCIREIITKFGKTVASKVEYSRKGQVNKRVVKPNIRYAMSYKPV